MQLAFYLIPIARSISYVLITSVQVFGIWFPINIVLIVLISKQNEVIFHGSNQKPRDLRHSSHLSEFFFNENKILT